MSQSNKHQRTEQTTALVFVFKVVKYNKYFTINKGNGLVLTRVKLKLS